MTALCLFAPSCGARADDPYNPRDTYGEIGLLDMPSARMAPDGQMSFTVGALQGTQRYNLGFQITPWLETSFRYSHVIKFTGTLPFYDRSFGMKLRLFEETQDFPEISLGLRDMLGTGVYGGEYLVASKHFWDFDGTLGLGWGRFAQRDAFKNPFALLFSSFKERNTSFGQGGTISFGQFFHGPKVGLFGGAIWHTPIDRLDVVVEYSSDRYNDEVSTGSIKVRSPINIGLSYKALDLVQISAGWLYGSSYGITVSMNGDPTSLVSPQRFGPSIPQPFIRPPKSQVDALTLLLARNRPVAASVANAQWVTLPVSKPDAETSAIASALMSEAAGVHDVDVMGDTLLVDARIAQHAEWQCGRFAEVLAGLAPHLTSIAVSDSTDSSGKVSICQIRQRNIALTEGANSPDTGGAASDDIGGMTNPDPVAVERKIRTDIAAQSLGVEALAVEPEMVWLYYSNTQYQSESEAAGRIARILMADAPSSAEIFHIVLVRNGMTLRDFRIARSALERAISTYGTPRELDGAISSVAPDLSNPILDKAWDNAFPRLHWDIGPGLREGFFDPHRPLAIQILAALNARLDITHNVDVEGRFEANIFNDYNFNQPPDSVLPHVRTDIAEYLRQGANGISKLDTVYRTRLSRDIYVEAKAGILEDMYTGGGLQVLWRPEGSRFAFGADIYQVWKRDFDRLFGVQDYQIMTGHASIYYASPWYGLNLAVHVGRYLAGDYGATFEVTRRFSTGVEVGAFATLTNVPFSKFGEGSFDKGIVVHIPLEWALPFYTQTSYDILLRSLARDGGQRLADDDSLFGETHPSSYGEVLGKIDEVTAP